MSVAGPGCVARGCPSDQEHLPSGGLCSVLSTNVPHRDYRLSPYQQKQGILLRTLEGVIGLHLHLEVFLAVLNVCQQNCICDICLNIKVVHTYCHTVDSRYSGSLKYGHLDIPAIWLGTEC